MFPGLQGGPLEHVIAAKAVAFREAMDPSFRDYAAQIVTNAAALAAGLGGEGFRLVSGGTDNHLMLVDLRTFDADLTGKQAQEVLDRAGITLNLNTIPDDPRSPFVTSGVRIGTPAPPRRACGSRRWPRSPRSSPGPCATATTTPSWPPSATTSRRSAPSSRRTDGVTAAAAAGASRRARVT